MALNTNLVGYWKLDDVVDATGLNTNLTNNGVATFATGKIGNAVNLVRASVQYLSHASTANLQIGAGDFSLTCWVNLASKTPADRAILSKSVGGPEEYVLYYQTSGDVFIFRVNLQAQSATTFGSPSLSTWYFIASTWNNSTKTTSISVNAGTADSTVQASAGATDTNAFLVGAYNVNGIPWDGLIDEVGMWTRVLTAAEITQLYNGGVGLAYPFPTTGSDDLSGYGEF